MVARGGACGLSPCTPALGPWERQVEGNLACYSWPWPALRCDPGEPVRPLWASLHKWLTVTATSP